MSCFVFRNNTVEFLFDPKKYSFSGYDDISFIPENVDAYIWFYQPPYGIETEHTFEEIESLKNKFDFVRSKVKAEKPFIVFTMANLFSHKIVGFRFDSDFAVNDFNNHVFSITRGNKNVKVVDITEFTRIYTSRELLDWRYYFISQAAFNPKLAKDFRAWFERKISQINMQRKKCVVLDLDNTLWGGVLGEDGIEGIKIGGNYPGKAFLYFQKFLVELEKSGIILAVCSKNNETDVLECWSKNPFNCLKQKHIAAYRINWNNKADNIKQIADELNIGLDSMVFIDDSPAERELVKQVLPQVSVPDFPSQPSGLAEFAAMLSEKYFSVYSLTNEDKNKTAEYKANAERKREQEKFTDLEGFIKSLDIRLLIQRANSMNIGRIAQMMQKTNQFNLTTKRYTEADLLGLLKNGADIFCISMSDKFGDSGITGAMIVMDGEIDEFLMSCRVLGKNIETAFLYTVLEILKENGAEKICASYIPTAKNRQVCDFYERNGFSLVSEDDIGTRHYEVYLKNLKGTDLSDYKIEVLEDKYD